MRSRLLLLILLIALILVIGSANAATGHILDIATDPLIAIQERYEQGELSLDEKVLLQIEAIKTPNTLPGNFMSTSESDYKSNSRMATIVLRDIYLQLEQLLPATRATYAQAFAREEGDLTFVSPGGQFLLHYDTIGVDAVPSTDDDSSGVSDFIEHLAAYCDSSLVRHSELGYLPPVSDGTAGGDDKIDVYFASGSVYGFAIIEGGGPEPWSDAFGYLTLNSDFQGFPPNNDPEGDALGAAKATIAHELHHLIQFAYDFTEASWFIEMDAAHIEDLVFDASDDNYNYLDSFFVAPGKSLMDNGLHKYASFIYPLYLSQFFDTSLMVAVWEGARYATAFSTLSDSLLGRYGWTQDSAFAEFAVWNYITNSRDDGLHHEEAAAYPAINVASQHSTYPVPNQNCLTAPGGYAAGYVEFFPPPTPNVLQITFNGTNAHQWSAFLVKSTSENVHEVEKLTLDPPDYLATVQIDQAENYNRIALIGVNTTEFGTGALFSFSASTFIPRDVASEITTQFTEVYSGGQRSFQYAVENPAPLSDVYDLTVWDDSSWTSGDSLRIAIASGSTYVFVHNYGPPQGTSLGNSGSLHFAARSVNNQTVTDSQSVSVEAILQRGDVNFTGSIDIADVTAVVGYMFKGGPDPVPLLDAADFTCDGSVDINDLTRLVAYQFKSGDPSSCNPY